MQHCFQAVGQHGEFCAPQNGVNYVFCIRTQMWVDYKRSAYQKLLDDLWRESEADQSQVGSRPFIVLEDSRPVKPSSSHAKELRAKVDIASEKAAIQFAPSLGQ